MKLSEAILLGSVGTEQSYGPLAIMPNSKSTCALGAALFAVGSQTNDPERAYKQVEERWPWILAVATVPSVLARLGDEKGDICSIIWRLNDTARWTRPQIAAWVAELEAVYDPDPVPGPVHESVAVQ